MGPEKVFGIRGENCIGFGQFDQKNCTDYAEFTVPGFAEVCTFAGRTEKMFFSVKRKIPYVHLCMDWLPVRTPVARHWVAIGRDDTDIPKCLVGVVSYCNVTKRTHTSDFFRGVTVHLPENCVKVPKCLRKRTVGSNFSILVFNSAHNYWSLSVSFSEKTENEMIKIQAALQNFSDSDLLPELFAATRKYVIKLKLKVLKPFLPLPANTAISVTGPYR